MENPSFKKALLNEIIDIETGASKELYFLDFLTKRYEGGTTKDMIVSANDLEKDELEVFISIVSSDYYNLVLDVPDYISWFFYPVHHDKGIKDNYMDYPFVIYPDIKARNSNNKWVGLGEWNGEEERSFSNDGIPLYEIGPRGRYHEIIPFFVKRAELSFLLSTGSRNDEKRAYISRYYGDVNEGGIVCIMDEMDAIAEPITLGNNIYQRVEVMELRDHTIICNTKLPPISPISPPENNDEICNNGVDDDGDGEIDEDDCVPQVEIDCTDGIDNDEDGLIDTDDPDCSCDCLRDCQQDHNFLVKHTFREVQDYWRVTSEQEQLAGKEKLINLRYDITRLNAPACPPGVSPCPFTTNFKYAVDFATRLFCDEEYQDGEGQDELENQEIVTLCITNPEEWNALPDGFFYGYISENQPSGTEVWFGTLNGLYAEIIGCNAWVLETVYYLPGVASNDFADWDASIYGDLIKINVSEEDNDELAFETQGTQSYTITTSFESKKGSKISVETPNPGGGTSTTEVSEEKKYSFSGSQTFSVSNTFTVQAANLVQLGNFELEYCDDQETTAYSNPVLQNDLENNPNLQETQKYSEAGLDIESLSIWEVIVLDQ